VEFENALNSAYSDLILSELSPIIKQKILQVLDHTEKVSEEEFLQLDFRVAAWREEFGFLIKESVFLEFLSKHTIVLAQAERASLYFHSDLVGLQVAAYEILRGGTDVTQLIDYSFLVDIEVARSFFNASVWFYISDINYNFLRDVLSYYIAWINFIFQETDLKTALSLIKDYTFFLRKTNGRVVNVLPVLDLDFFYKKIINSKESSLEFIELCFFYFKSLVMNCFYEDAEKILNGIAIYESNVALSVFMKCCGAIYENPVRSEKNGSHREEIRKKLISNAYGILQKDKEKWIDFKINLLLKSTLERNVEDVIFNMRLLKKFLKRGESPEEMEVLKIRAKECVFSVKFLISAGQYSEAILLLKLIKSGVGAFARKKLVFQITAQKGDNLLLDALIKDDDRILKYYKCKQIYALNLKSRGDFFNAERLMRESASAISDRFKVASIHRMADKIKFLGETSDLINSTIQLSHQEIKGVVFIATLGCMNSLAMLAPSLVEVKKKGYAVIHLSSGSIFNENLGLACIDGMSSTIPTLVNDGTVKLDWMLDFKNKKMICDNVNYYQGIYEHMSVKFRRFHIDIEDVSIRRNIDLQIRCADFILRICKLVKDSIVSKNIPVVFVSGNSHISPYSVFRDYCLAENNPKMRFVASNVAYENYYSNLGGKFSGSMAVVDMTLHRTCRAPFLAIRERFDAWYLANLDDPHIEGRVNKLLSANRVARTSQEISLNLQRVLDAKEQGVKILCCFGKILCDLAVPYDGGPAHTDIVDWLNHTIEVVKDNPNILLLIKPHPHELRSEIALDLVEFLRDVVPETLPKNVVFLDHKEFNVAEMANLLDLAILWNGTSSLELAIMDVPVMMCSYFGRHDYPVDLIYPQSREQYRDYLKATIYAKPSIEVRRRSAALLHYMGTTEVALPNRYSRRPITNDSVGVPTWDKKLLEEFLTHGDVYMSTAADRILEGVDVDCRPKC